MSGFQSPITIQQALAKIDRSEYFLPAFQREYVWSTDQIENLFDSLMRGYPINSMLFWKVRGNIKTDFRFYQFLRNVIQKYNIHNEHISTTNINDFYAILDGQQRLTSLFIGLCGSYANHTPYRSWEYSEWSFPTRHLYLNITKLNTVEESDKRYNFKFLRKEKTDEVDLFRDNNGNMWFKAGRILSLHNNEHDYDLDDFIEDNKLSKSSRKILRKFDRVIHNLPLINYYEEDEQDPDKAVNIFVRINSGGTHLTFSDILMSIAIANWRRKDARTEVFNLVDSVNSKDFNISKDYILKSFLFLYHRDVRSKINSFNHGFIERIEDNWESIRNSILSLFDLLRTFGLNHYTLTANNATLPILYYIYHKKIYDNFSIKTKYEKDRKVIKNWLLGILIRKTFGGQGDFVLAQARQTFTDDTEKNKINDIEMFPANEINKKIQKINAIGDDYINELLETQKDSRYSFSILALLYPHLDYKNNNFHQDHLHPASRYENLLEKDKKEYGWWIYNSILNLQMLDANDNMSKGDMNLKDWVITKINLTTDQINEEENMRAYKSFLDIQLIPNTNLSINNFSVFIKERRKILNNKLKDILKN